MPAKRILLVEDEPNAHELLTHALIAEGYIVDAAPTAAKAWQFLEARPYALVIADWRLPDGNGIDLADRAATLSAKTLIISGYLFGLPAGVADRHELLMKPVRPLELIAAVERSIGKSLAG
jgi:DNA-binding response OmpR family regulator